ncbi:hypothetical protein ULO1_00230 [Carboxydocella sp. ULO1]|nr:hypothetical protein ULO1_00230 [Carboxydocella sp. ULO1]
MVVDAIANAVIRFEPTYEELKHIAREVAKKHGYVLSLHMRN